MVYVSSLAALKTITAELPQEGKIAAKACEKLTPKLLSQLQNVRVPATRTHLPTYLPHNSPKFHLRLS